MRHKTLSSLVLPLARVVVSKTVPLLAVCLSAGLPLDQAALAAFGLGGGAGAITAMMGEAGGGKGSAAKTARLVAEAKEPQVDADGRPLSEWERRKARKAKAEAAKKTAPPPKPTRVSRRMVERVAAAHGIIEFYKSPWRASPSDPPVPRTEPVLVDFYRRAPLVQGAYSEDGMTADLRNALNMRVQPKAAPAPAAPAAAAAGGGGSGETPWRPGLPVAAPPPPPEWTEEERMKLFALVERDGVGNWQTKANALGTHRSKAAVSSQWHDRLSRSEYQYIERGDPMARPMFPTGRVLAPPPDRLRAEAVRQRSSLLKAVITAFTCVSLPFLAVPLLSQRTVAIRPPKSCRCRCRCRRPRPQRRPKPPCRGSSRAAGARRRRNQLPPPPPPQAGRLLLLHAGSARTQPGGRRTPAGSARRPGASRSTRTASSAWTRACGRSTPARKH
eukprot:SAG22_NODE_1198_length_5193_cov_12.289360_4_plen_445_part_00